TPRRAGSGRSSTRPRRGSPPACPGARRPARARPGSRPRTVATSAPGAAATPGCTCDTPRPHDGDAAMVRFVLGAPQPVPYVLPRPPVVGELAVDACAPGTPARVLSNPAPGMLLLDGQDTPVPARQLAAVAPASHPPQVSLVDDDT